MKKIAKAEKIGETNLDLLARILYNYNVCPQKSGTKLSVKEFL